jgi:hypothetical protein
MEGVNTTKESSSLGGKLGGPKTGLRRRGGLFVRRIVRGKTVLVQIPPKGDFVFEPIRRSE